MPKKVTPKNPEAPAKASVDDKSTSRTTERKTAAAKSGRRKVGRKTGASRWG